MSTKNKKIPSLQALAFDQLSTEELAYIAKSDIYRRGFAQKIENNYMRARANPSYNAIAQYRMRENERQRELRTNSSYEPYDFNQRMNTTKFKKHMCIDNGTKLTKKAMIQCFSSALNKKLDCYDLEALFRSLYEADRSSLTKQTLVKICRVLPRELLARATVKNLCRRPTSSYDFRFTPVIALIRKSCGNKKLTPAFCLYVMNALRFEQIQLIVREYHMCDEAHPSLSHFTIDDHNFSYSHKSKEWNDLRLEALWARDVDHKKNMLQCFQSATKHKTLTCNNMCDFLSILDTEHRAHPRSRASVAPICHALSLDILVDNAVEEIRSQFPEERHGSFEIIMYFFELAGESEISKQTYLRVLGALPTADLRAVFEAYREEDFYDLQTDDAEDDT